MRNPGTALLSTRRRARVTDAARDEVFTHDAHCAPLRRGDPHARFPEAPLAACCSGSPTGALAGASDHSRIQLVKQTKRRRRAASSSGKRVGG